MKTFPQNSWPTPSRADTRMSTLSKKSAAFGSVVFLAGLAAFLIFVYWNSVAVMFGLGRMSSDQHGLLVVFISAYLIWRLLPQVSSVQLRGDLWGVAAVAALVLVWIMSRLVGVQALEHFSVLALLPASVYAVAGREYVGKLLFPLLFLLCAVPIGDSLVPPMMAITADVSSFLLRVSGIPVLRDGQNMTLPGGSFVIAEVCSGVRYLMSGLILSLLFAHLTYRDNRKRIAFISIAAVLLVLANGLRAYLVMAIASASEMRYLGGADHIYFGWVLFGIVIMSIIWVGAKFSDAPLSAETASLPSESISGNLAGLPLVMIMVFAMLVATFSPLQSDSISIAKLVVGLIVFVVAIVLAGRRQRSAGGDDHQADYTLVAGRRRSLGIVAIVALLLVCGPQSISLLRAGAISVASVPDIADIESCTRQKPWAPGWYPRVRGADVDNASTFSCDDGDVSVFVAGYATALQGKELVSSSNRLTPRKWRRYIKASVFEHIPPSGERQQVKELVVDAPEYRGLVWYWYEIDSHRATGQFSVKVLQLWALLRGRPAGGHVVLVTTPLVAGVREARQRLEKMSIDLGNTGMLTVPGDDA